MPMPRPQRGAACRRHRARGNDVAGAPMLVRAPRTASGLRRRRWCPPFRIMLALAWFCAGLVVARFKQHRVAFEAVGDLQQRQAQRGAGVRRKLGRFGTRVRARHFRGRAASLGGLLVRRRAHPLSLVVWTWHATLGAQTLDAPAASLVARIGWSRAAMLRRLQFYPVPTVYSR